MMIECPHCHTQYTAERCGIRQQHLVAFTIKCMVCAKEFDGMVERVEAQPPSRLYKYTVGMAGQPKQPAIFRAHTQAR